MCSVALAMAFSLERSTGHAAASPERSPAKCPLPVLRAFYAASDVPVYEAVRPGTGFDIAWHPKTGKKCMMSMMYQAYQNHRDRTAPWRTGAASALKYLNLVPQGVSDKLFGRLAAALELISRTSLTYARPAYDIGKVMVGNQELEVTEEVVFATPFGSLLHFKKENSAPQPRMLLVAPMSGHFATLLRGTVKTLLQDHDVYITDWHNPREIPLDQGKCGPDEYTEHLITFLDRIGPRAHMVAICQPSVSALPAAAIMSEDDHPARPATLTLMAGPIDTRIQPTKVNDFAKSKPLKWFEENLINYVPVQCKGAFRQG